VVRGAADRGVDLLILHHGMFWSGNLRVTGPRFDQLSMLFSKGIAVYSSHLPLDLHPRLGNNALLVRQFGLSSNGGFASSQGVQIGLRGDSDLETEELFSRVRAFCEPLGHHLVATPIEAGRRTRKWGLCSGAGASPETLREAVALGLDTIIVGEGPHHTAVQAGDLDLTIMYAGHYATETPGVRALAAETAQRFGIASSFIDVPTGL
jgi:dinuclear metal center YbgI/SA1388 family protein